MFWEFKILRLTPTRESFISNFSQACKFTKEYIFYRSNSCYNSHITNHGIYIDYNRTIAIVLIIAITLLKIKNWVDNCPPRNKKAIDYINLYVWYFFVDISFLWVLKFFPSVKDFLKMSQNPQENICTVASSLIDLYAGEIQF